MATHPSPQARTRVVDVGDSSPLVGVIYDEILHGAFIPDELISCDRLRAILRDGLGVLTAVVDGEGRPLAAAVGEWDPGSRVLLLSYVAVRRESRSGGLGRLLMDEVRGAWQQRFRPEMTLAEIEHPAAHSGDEERGDAAARVRFYERLGARALDLPYFQPALRPGAERVYGMLLIALPPLPGGGGPDGPVDSAPVRAFLTAYFVESEGAVGTDPASARLWRAVDQAGGIALLPLSDPSALPLSHA
ncbi:GNAT family N-acetyltransferase [Streptomyces sp. NBC_00247]|uniref:GNAT family N-acetyltransferase n=1 Tax=Streptomyces sp. NBC_00247 TaxID=2975689 RepID=UPI002E2AA7A7|nr:GNAT family N-acetyltransferase [Streptomyces sp. NBC_00247]